MMGGWGMMGGGMGLFGWFFGLIFSLGLLILLGLAIIWLVRQVNPTSGSNAPFGAPPANTAVTGGRTCPTCNRPMAPEWTTCPYDGTPLTTGQITTS
ncbi:MAG: hypothetical protein Q9O62_09970 [Ardenticatenia bacterium]|nr:hypothetical protein [Ardenticatenia bacterium]